MEKHRGMEGINKFCGNREEYAICIIGLGELDAPGQHILCSYLKAKLLWRKRLL